MNKAGDTIEAGEGRSSPRRFLALFLPCAVTRSFGPFCLGGRATMSCRKSRWPFGERSIVTIRRGPFGSVGARPHDQDRAQESADGAPRAGPHLVGGARGFCSARLTGRPETAGPLRIFVAASIGLPARCVQLVRLRYEEGGMGLPAAIAAHTPNGQWRRSTRRSSGFASPCLAQVHPTSHDGRARGVMIARSRAEIPHRAALRRRSNGQEEFRVLGRTLLVADSGVARAVRRACSCRGTALQDRAS